MYRPGDQNYRAYVGYYEKYDIMSASQFNLLTSIGLREINTVCDFGCGSLRLGRLLINFLQTENYYGIDPNKWLINEGIANELGDDIVKKKKPKFTHFDDFDFNQINKTFDFIISKSVFTHACLEYIEKALGTISNVMNDDSIFVSTFILGKNNYNGTDKWIYPGVVPYKFSTIKKIAHENSLQCDLINWKDGQNWLYFCKNSISKHKLNNIRHIGRANSVNFFALKKFYYSYY